MGLPPLQNVESAPSAHASQVVGRSLSFFLVLIKPGIV